MFFRRVDKTVTCPQCGYIDRTIADTGPIKDAEGKEMYIRESCPNCNWVRGLTGEEIQKIINSIKIK